MTKEELIIENTKLEDRIKKLVCINEERRKEFAKALDWNGNGYIDHKEPLTPSWEEIFVEVGKLLAFKSFKNNKDDISELQRVVENLNNEVFNERDEH